VFTLLRDSIIRREFDILLSVWDLEARTVGSRYLGTMRWMI